MKAYTKTLIQIRNNDLSMLRINNSKSRCRTIEENTQAINDKADFYIRKWNDLLYDAETPTQKAKCQDVISRIEEWRKNSISAMEGELK